MERKGVMSFNAMMRLENERLKRQIMEQKRVITENRLIHEARRADRECWQQEFEARKRRDPEWIEKQLYKEAIAADREIFEAQEAARGVDLVESYKRERRLSSGNQVCFITGPFKLIVARNMPIAKKHHYVRLKMGGQKPVTCDRLGLLPN